jgi:hypothetical protein
MNNLYPRALSIEEIETGGNAFKDDLTRECERMVRRGNTPGALAAIYGKEYIDKFVYTLKLRAGSQLGLPSRARPIRIFRKKGQ